MKKFLRISSVAVLLLLVAAWFVVPRYILGMITNYEPFTFERVLDSEEWRASYGIFDKEHPRDYGFDNVEELDYLTVEEDVQLNGWYVETTAPAEKCLVLIHGRTSNRLKTMKYLELFKATGLDSVYNFFIPDLRNSGKSQIAKTYMGYKFGEDLAASLLTLNKEKGSSDFVLYGFSMGAMAIATLLGREDLVSLMNDNSIKVNQLILDSSLSNVKETLRVNSQNLGLPGFLFDQSFALYGDAINGFGEQMRFGYLLNGVEQPILVLHTRNDNRTPFAILTKELELLSDKANIETHFFDGPRHVRIYQTDSLKLKYQSIIEGFLRK